MNLEKLFGSKTKVDILKYLIFRRQWVSMRALETELWWTFPAIKKQTDSLDDAWIIKIDKEHTWWSIHLKPSLIDIFEEEWEQISSYFWWNIFWKEIGVDLFIVYNNMEKEKIDNLKNKIGECFRDYWIETVSITTMSSEQRETRLRLTDKFALNVMKYYNNIR